MLKKSEAKRLRVKILPRNPINLKKGRFHGKGLATMGEDPDTDGAVGQGGHYGG